MILRRDLLLYYLAIYTVCQGIIVRCTNSATASNENQNWENHEKPSQMHSQIHLLLHNKTVQLDIA